MGVSKFPYWWGEIIEVEVDHHYKAISKCGAIPSFQDSQTLQKSHSRSIPRAKGTSAKKNNLRPVVELSAIPVLPQYISNWLSKALGVPSALWQKEITQIHRLQLIKTYKECKYCRQILNCCHAEHCYQTLPQSVENAASGLWSIESWEISLWWLCAIWLHVGTFNLWIWSSLTAFL